jgi:mRNA interferase RelE/StbE
MWRVEFGRRAERQLDKLDPVARSHLLKVLKRGSTLNDPREVAEPLAGNWSGYWRFRAGQYRAICEFRAERLIVHVVEVGHRFEVYR